MRLPAVMNLDEYSEQRDAADAALVRVYPNTTKGFEHLREQQLVRPSMQPPAPPDRAADSLLTGRTR